MTYNPIIESVVRIVLGKNLLKYFIIYLFGGLPAGIVIVVYRRCFTVYRCVRIEESPALPLRCRESMKKRC